MENKKQQADFENAQGEADQHHSTNVANTNSKSVNAGTQADQQGEEKAGPDGLPKQMDGNAKSFDRDQEAIELGLNDGDLDTDVRTND
jgi:hypothetical protein